MLSKDDLQAIEKLIKAEAEPINKRLDAIEKNMATKSDLQSTEKRLSGTIERETSDLGELFNETWQAIEQQNTGTEERLDRLEEHAGLKTHKN